MPDIQHRARPAAPQVPVATLVLSLLLAPWRRRPRPASGVLRHGAAAVALPVTLTWWAVVGAAGMVAVLVALAASAFLGLAHDGV